VAVVAALIVLVCALAVAPVTHASEFTVDSTADGIDAVPGDESCLTAGGECTLRAAIEEADSLKESGTIQFDEDVFKDGAGAAATINLSHSLPTVTVPLTINGRTCKTAIGASGPCVGIDGASAEPALIFANVEEIEVWGLAITGARTAISLEGSPRGKIRASWFGLGLDGGSGGNGIGVLVGPGSNGSFIGGEGVEHRNVFVASLGNALDIHGADNAKVFGNYFGVDPDGVTPRVNGGDDIEVVSIEEFEATGAAIGTRVSAAAAASRQCDGGCNVISGAAANGVDLRGDGAPETPAASTAIAGNYFGLNAAGTAAIPNAGAGVSVGEAAHTIIGGPSAGEANRVNGGSVGILAGPAAADLSVRGNLIGTDVTGTETLAPPGDGIVVDSAALPSPTVEAEIVGNEIGMEGGVAISQRGQGAWILDNRIFGPQVGIKTFESSEYGNVIEGNLIEDPTANGIVVENDLNEVLGNAILGAGGAGIWIQGALLKFGVGGNLIGGDTAEDENFIAGSGGAAIEISSLENTRNEVARNMGIANGGLFIDLVAVSADTELGPNDGIEPPQLAVPTEAGVSGGAEVDAKVRVFRKQSGAPGELDSFLGETIADSSGSWEVTFDSAIPAGTVVAATQSKFGGTSELATAMVPGGAGVSSDGGGGNAGSGVGDAGGSNGLPRWPRTRIVKAPKARSRSNTARFAFNSSERGSVFLCKLDDKPFDLCGSPKKYEHLKPGRHAFEVRAINPAGRVDPTPAKKKFIVLD
jgi:CSLREA domain-containing protein